MPFKNTGEQEIEQVDTNPLSPTFGARRWVVSAFNPAACPVPPPANPTFRSALIVEVVFRDDCTGGQTPNGVTYRVEEGFRTSLLSQADADTQARTYFNSQKQAFANANDTCSVNPADAYSCESDINGCWSGYVVFTSDGRREYYTTADQHATCFVPTTVPGSTQVSDLCPAI